MAQTLTIIKGVEESREVIAHHIGIMRDKLKSLNKASWRKTFSRKRVRVNMVYVLLVASIFLTLLSTIVTCTEISDKNKIVNKGVEFAENSVLHRDSRGFNPLRFSSFVLLALTCSLALSTIIKKDKNNGRLLSKLKSTNRQLEAEVQKRTNELAEAIKAKDHFLGVATHDLKAPLNGIMGLVELIKIGNNKRSTSEDEYLAHIEYSCRKMQRLVHDILEINRIEQGKAVVKRQPVDLVPLLNKLWLGFGQEAGKKSIELVIEKVDATIHTDADSLTRILENLLSNAIKFSPSRKKVWLNVSLEAEHVRFEVADEGPGIPPDEQPRLFNKFQRLSNQPTNSENSTGLGLSIVKELVAQLGGEIVFKSGVEKGSIFIVTLPQSHPGCNLSEIHTGSNLFQSAG